MTSDEEKAVTTKYLYYDYHNGNIAREVVGNNEFAMDRFEFYIKGKWINYPNLSLSLSDATMDFDGSSVWDYEELTEDEAMRRIAEIEKTYVDDATIIDYVKSANLKGKITLENYGFIWDLKKISLKFIFNSGEMEIEYFRRKKKLKFIGHLHVYNEDVINMIDKINRDDKVVRITLTFLGSTFEIVNKADKRKKSWVFVRRYYSC